ncbi:MAG TPA: hypothetical protein VLQ79_11620 [Myxococcaceae bacterium]|nr:hypothetical protein [Myxococcaceae bacterium]
MKTIVKMILVVSALSSMCIAAEVDRRAVRQQERIGEGVESGQLPPRETARLEGQEARIQNEIKADRAANGGHLTLAEHRSINRQQDRVSRHIYTQKHDAQHR